MQGDLYHLATCWLFRMTLFTDCLHALSKAAYGSTVFQSRFDKSNSFYFSCELEGQNLIGSSSFRFLQKILVKEIPDLPKKSSGILTGI